MRSPQFAARVLVACSQGCAAQKQLTQCHSLNKFVLLDGIKSQGSQKRTCCVAGRLTRTRRFEAFALPRAEAGRRHHHRAATVPAAARQDRHRRQGAASARWVYHAHRAEHLRYGHCIRHCLLRPDCPCCAVLNCALLHYSFLVTFGPEYSLSYAAGVTHPLPDPPGFHLPRADWEHTTEVAHRQPDSCPVPAQQRREPYEHETTAHEQVAWSSWHATSGLFQRPACPGN